MLINLNNDEINVILKALIIKLLLYFIDNYNQQYRGDLFSLLYFYILPYEYLGR